MIIKVSALFFATIIAFWISAICGGGASLVLIPILNLLLPSPVVPISLTLGTFTSSASQIAVFRKHINWKIFMWFVPCSIPAVMLGAFLLKYINPTYLQLFVALFLIANLPQLFKSKKAQEKEEKPYPKYILGIIGFLAGFVSGVTGTIGLLFNRFYLKYGLSKEGIVATRAANEICLHLIKIVIYISLGLFSKTALWLGLTIATASIISSYTIKFILPYLSKFVFRKIGYGAMVVSGFILLFNTSGKIIKQDKVSISQINKNNKTETQLKWRNSDFSLEYSWNGTLEIERSISAEELSENILKRYENMKSNYDTILIEKVFTFNSEPYYEFYAYKRKEI
ncbi:sulfite exporter TauE/SafE family protein [Riemerella columbipharyngis]|uniref:Probable membrane transporter protein n=1 Tax=Riemerella columbipharyngis TaxID=1071918 RepID=A0A1G7F4U9_9FLAO|nr:sulfite exporter TauE/SafE family protein [Riemerella columbipharyngis]SDE70897.1 hypothetical protein SAMN05421544_11922 [Riemerella columbipharyngis]